MYIIPHNFLVGLNTLDLDIRRAAETIGWDARRAFDRLPMLEPGDFVAVGPAFSRNPAVTRVGPVKTKQGGAMPILSAPAMIGAKRAAELLDIGDLIEASAGDAEIRRENAYPPGLKGVRTFIRDPSFPLAARIWDALKPLYPKGAAVVELASALGIESGSLENGLALLDSFGVLHFSDAPKSRAVRIMKDMR